MKVEVTDDMVLAGIDAAHREEAKPNIRDRYPRKAIFEAMLTHPDFQRQLRDMVLAAVPGEERPVTHGGAEESYAAAFNACRAETTANINALFDKENGNGSN